MRILGTYWCPRCFMRTQATLAPGATMEEELPDLECVDCGYIHTTVYTEHADGTAATARHSIPKEARIAERERRKREFTDRVVRAGFPRENLTQPTRRKDRRNHG